MPILIFDIQFVYLVIHQKVIELLISSNLRVYYFQLEVIPQLIEDVFDAAPGPSLEVDLVPVGTLSTYECPISQAGMSTVIKMTVNAVFVVGVSKQELLKVLSDSLRLALFGARIERNEWFGFDWLNCLRKLDLFYRLN